MIMMARRDEHMTLILFSLFILLLQGVSSQSVQGHRPNQEGAQRKLGNQGRTFGAAFSVFSFFLSLVLRDPFVLILWLRMISLNLSSFYPCFHSMAMICAVQLTSFFKIVHSHMKQRLYLLP